MNPLPCRLLMTADAIGGVWTYAEELARALAPRGVEIALAVMGGGLSGAQRQAVEDWGNVTLFEGDFRLEWMDDPWADVDRAGEWLLGIADGFGADVVHLNGYAHAALPWGVPVLTVAHSCVLSWWSAVKGGPAPARYDAYRERVKRGLAAADGVVAPSAAMLAALGEQYGPVPRARVIANARNPRGFSRRVKQPKILAAGRLWDEAKNVAALAAAAPRVGWPIEVAGEGEPPGGQGGRAEFGDVRYLGKLAAGPMAARLAEAAIYALPARYEPFGLSALEAGLSRCALVLGDIPSLREIWGEAAVFVAPGDVDELARTLNGLADDPARLANFGRRARERALRFTPDRMANAYLAAYRSCLAQPVLAEAANEFIAA